ncbi:unnamed protein product [Dicrocoelium dendriticum]|nr:unnamed protein product [Dicrocoelium dendriticum]
MRYFSGVLSACSLRCITARLMSTMVNEHTCGLLSGLSEKSLPPPPEFIEHRNRLWSKLRKEYEEFVSAQPRSLIQITLPDGATVEGKAWETTPMAIAKIINKDLAEHAVIARVNGELWDLLRPFEKDATLELLNFEHKDGQYVFWHSSAHILGEAMEQVFGGHLCYGPPIETGFYYDMWLPEVHKGLGPDDHAVLDVVCRRICKENQPFERLEVTKNDLLAMFAYNKFKCRIIQDKVATPTTTVYKCGPLIDLCRGPHVRHTGCVKAMMVTKSSSAYWEGQADAESLQRVYGISFPDPKRLKEWKHFQEEAARRDHRKLGVEQKLFFFHELSPGSCFFLPAGAHIYNTLISFIRSEYWRRGFQEVITPNVYNSSLWEISGHWQHYSVGLFVLTRILALLLRAYLVFWRAHQSLPNQYAIDVAIYTRVLHWFLFPHTFVAQSREPMDFVPLEFGINGFYLYGAYSTPPVLFRLVC